MTDDQIAEVYRTARSIAIVGASSKPERDSNDVMAYLVEQGYQVIPVNPRETRILGRAVVGTLAEAPGDLDVVVAFRRAEEAPDVAREAVARGAKVLWLPLGVVSSEAGKIAEDAGLGFVQDRCIKATHKLMRGAGMV